MTVVTGVASKKPRTEENLACICLSKLLEIKQNRKKSRTFLKLSAALVSLYALWVLTHTP